MKYKASAPCKINLHLAIGDKRADGFHNIESIFLLSDALTDILEIEIKDDGMGAYADNMNIEGNLMFKAFKLFQRKSGADFSVDIKIEKNIPAGGGLGGASSDAAAVLKILNEAAGRAFSQNELLEAGAVLGSDVPFFLSGCMSALVSGRGEKIEPVSFAPFPLFPVFLRPPFASPTPRAYKLFDDYHNGAPPPLQSADDALKDSLKDAESVISACRNNLYRNDFLKVFLESGSPDEKFYYGKFISDLKKEGAVFTSLSGSGSVVFGLFEEAPDIKSDVLREHIVKTRALNR